MDINMTREEKEILGDIETTKVKDEFFGNSSHSDEEAEDEFFVKEEFKEDFFEIMALGDETDSKIGNLPSSTSNKRMEKDYQKLKVCQVSYPNAEFSCASNLQDDGYKTLNNVQETIPSSHSGSYFALKHTEISDTSGSEEFTDSDEEKENDLDWAELDFPSCDETSSENETRTEPQRKRKCRQKALPFAWRELGENGGLQRDIGVCREAAGVNIMNDSLSMYGIFSEIFPEKIFQLMVEETNKYAQLYLQSHKNLKPGSRYTKWKPTSIGEMKKFIGLLLLMGILHKPQINMYWRKDELICTSAFASIMRRDRFCNLLSFWHFSHNSTQGSSNSSSNLRKIETLLHIMNESLKEKYYPTKDLCLAESLLVSEGILDSRGYVKSERCTFGIKIFKVVDSNGVTIVTKVYPETINALEDFSKSESVVVDLMGDFLGKNHHVYTGNYYTSPKLYKYLKVNKTGATGTVKNNKANLPRELRCLEVEKGKKYAFETDELLCLVYSDKRNIYMLSNAHSNVDKSVNKRSSRGIIRQQLPACIIDYNKNRRFVEQTDQLLHSYTLTRKNIKWYKKLALHMLQVRVLDALRIYNFVNQMKVPFMDFALRLIKVLTFNRKPTPEEVAIPRLFGRHFPEKVLSKRCRNPRKRCSVCYLHGIIRTTKYQCKTCGGNPGLCITPCFEIYHTKNEY